jgi:hypothetical protein
VRIKQIWNVAKSADVITRRETLALCTRRKVGNKASIRVYFTNTCLNQANKRNVHSEDMNSFMHECEMQADLPCERAAADLRLIDIDRRRFKDGCLRSARGAP